MPTRKRARARRSSGKQRRLERRRAARDHLAAIAWDDVGRVVCERCGLEQPFRSSDRSGALTPCEGPLGLACAGETAITIEHYLELPP